MNVPVKVYSATQDHDIKFHQVHGKDNSNIHAIAMMVVMRRGDGACPFRWEIQRRREPMGVKINQLNQLRFGLAHTLRGDGEGHVHVAPAMRVVVHAHAVEARVLAPRDEIRSLQYRPPNRHANVDQHGGGRGPS